MKQFFKSTIRPILNKCGIDLVRYQPRPTKTSPFPPDFDEFTKKIYESVTGYTMTGYEKIHALVESVKYIAKNKIDGAMVECGVWRGGSVMAMSWILDSLGDRNRDIYLYDTFSGMSKPTEIDRSYNGESAQEEHARKAISENASDWCACSMEEVQRNVSLTGYPPEKFHFIKGKVQDTIPGTMPEKIALLRLDTDWYESTKHELIHLFPRIVPHGVIIIDDYGHWQGAKKAVDEFIEQNHLCILLQRINYSGRIAVKTPRTT